MERLQPNKYVSFGLALGAGILALSGCSEGFTYDQPGVVVKHEYDDPDTWVSFVRVGKSLTPVTHRDPAHWNLDIKQCGHDDRISDENPDGCHVFTEEVSHSLYDQYQDGDTIILEQ